MGFALVGLLSNWIFEKVKWLAAEPMIEGKRLPGIGIG